MPDTLDVLTLVIALAVYVASLRFAVVGRLGTEPPPKKPENLKWFLVALIPVDAALVSSGALLTVKLFHPDLFAGCFDLEAAAHALFALALGFLALHHVYAWYRSVLGVLR